MDIFEYENTQEKKTHGDLHFPFNIYPCTIPGDFASVPLHWHNDMEIIYIKKGSGMVFVDLAPHRVGEGDIVLIAPGQLHSIEQWEGAFMEYENIIFHLGMLMCAGGDLCSEQFFSPLIHNHSCLPVLIPVGSPLYSKVARCLDAIDELSGYGDALSALGIKGKLFDMFHLLFCHCRDGAAPRPVSPSLAHMKVILKHVETHYQEKLTIQEMARLCGFSGSHFMKFFRQQMGVSFVDYLNDYRLTMAARMLSASSDTVTTVAGACGFENLSYFNRLFKRKFKTTPTRYRKNLY